MIKSERWLFILPDQASLTFTVGPVPVEDVDGTDHGVILIRNNDRSVASLADHCGRMLRIC